MITSLQKTPHFSLDTKSKISHSSSISCQSRRMHECMHASWLTQRGSSAWLSDNGPRPGHRACQLGSRRHRKPLTFGRGCLRTKKWPPSDFIGAPFKERRVGDWRCEWPNETESGKLWSRPPIPPEGTDRPSPPTHSLQLTWRENTSPHRLLIPSYTVTWN